MKKQVVSILLLGASTTLKADNGELERLVLMREAVQTKTIEEFMVAINENNWIMPRIPSKWHIENRVENEEEKHLLQAARDFGYQLALRLKTLEQEQLEIQPQNTLYQRTHLILDLSDWCAKPVGYHNYILAWECLNLSVFGLNRLTVSKEFPIEKCEILSKRLNPDWFGKTRLLQILNDEAGAVLFINDQIPYIKLTWEFGGRDQLMRDNDSLRTMEEAEKQLGINFFKPDARFINIQTFLKNKDFFNEPNRFPELPKSFETWNSRHYTWLVGITELTNWRNDALNLIKKRIFEETVQ